MPDEDERPMSGSGSVAVEEQKDKGDAEPTPAPPENNMPEGSASPTQSTKSRSGSGGSPAPSIQSKSERIKATFVLPLEKKYECSYCNEVLRYPVQFKECGHRVCTSCFQEVTRTEQRCPQDQKPIDPSLSFVDKAFNVEILALDIKCNNHEWGCKWEGEYRQLQEHNDQCEYVDVICVNDCGAKFQKRFQQKHLDKDCPKKIIPCPYCDDRHYREEKKAHLEDCPDLPLPCPNKCDKKLVIPRKELDEHIQDVCPRTKLMCQYEDIGCAHRCSREKQPKHYKSELINHVKLIYEVVMAQKGELDACNASLARHEELIHTQEKRIGDLEKIAHSQLIWRIEDYTRKVKEAKSGNTDTLFSPTFTTSKHGYRLCASICPNGDGKGKGTHLSVFISILRGAYDALLKWPFDYRVTFYLLDQEEDPESRKHIKFSIKPNPCPENEPFLGRPKMEKNASFGGAKFAKHEEIEKEDKNYVKDDTIFLKIVVDCDGLSEP